MPEQKTEQKLRTRDIIGWKTYAVAALSCVLGIVAFSHGYLADGLKGVVFGLALIASRDVQGKIMRVIESERRAFDDLRATIEAHLPRND
ncbi:MAG: hypothetical protein MSG64_07420 [Pyrinomonadaceae bacterium MAG19_C2-C3]|nr:hypothetical protein [Pyrinomonadaceae bacterium MAG19_C2-C3]